MIASPSGFSSINLIQASTLGSIDPLWNWPSSIYFLASSTVISLSSCWFSLPKFIYTLSTAVRISSLSALISAESLLATKSLSITASTPL